MQITRITRAPYTFTLPASFGTVTAVEVAVLPKRHAPNGLTEWMPADDYDPDTRLVTINFLAGPDADATDALVVGESGGDLWAGDVDDPIVNAARIERIVVQGGIYGTVTDTLASQVLTALGEKVDTDDPRLSDSRTPSGGAGGALSGSYPNPGLNVAAVDTSVAANIGDEASETAAALRAAFVAGTVYENDGATVSTTKRLTVVLTADGLDIEDLIIEDVA